MPLGVGDPARGVTLHIHEKDAAVFKKLALLCLGLMLASAWAAGPAWSAVDKKQDKEVQALVKAAVKQIKAKGEAALPEFSKPGSKWLKGGHYIFVFDETGLELANGAAPQLEGKNFWDFQDAGGAYVTRDELALVKAKGKGWMEVFWPKPGQDKPEKCRVYLQGVKLKGKLLVVGSAYWLK